MKNPKYFYTDRDSAYWTECQILKENEKTYTIKYYNSWFKQYMTEDVRKNMVHDRPNPDSQDSIDENPVRNTK